MALNDFINDYPGWQNAAKANAQATRKLAAAQRKADSTPTTNKAVFNAAITELNKAKAERDAAKARFDTIVSKATQEFNAQSDKSELAKAQKQFDTYDNEIKLHQIILDCQLDVLT
jgi:regulator of protease activity HflC (stomatin/prohibitin superfamily)